MAEEPTDPGLLTEDLVGKVLAGRYRVLESIGQGGAGKVYLGVQEPLGRMVAIKVLRDDLRGHARKEFSARFEREAAVAGRLNHPNIVTIHDYGTNEDGLRFVVMERLTGKTLAAISKRTFLQPARAARLISDLAKGLAAAHDAGLIHRDVKPHNVVVQEEDGRERPVLLDFGLVKVVDPSSEHSDNYSTRAGTYMGTPAYMAPEQAKGEQMDHRVDIYALGCMLYRLLTGRTPYSAEHPLGMAIQHMTEPFPAMAIRAPEVSIPTELERITERCMAKSPDDRYPDCRALVIDLEAWLADSPAPAVAQPSSRKSVAVGAGVGVLGAGLGMVGVGLGAAALLAAVGVLWLLGTPELEAGSAIEPAVPLEAPAPVEAPALRPLPMPVPTAPLPPAPAPAPASVVVDEVRFSPEQARRALEFVNSAEPEQLREAGVYNRGVDLILHTRPYKTLDAFGATKGVGTKTVQAIARGSDAAR